MFHADCWSGEFGAGSCTAGAPVLAIVGIAGPSGGRLCAHAETGVATATKQIKIRIPLIALLSPLRFITSSPSQICLPALIPDWAPRPGASDPRTTATLY